MNKTIKRKLRKNKTMKKEGKKSRRFFHKKGKSTKKGKIVIKGGNINPASFQPFNELEGKYYEFNNHNNDPTNPTLILSSRNLPNMIGGRRKKKNKSAKKMKGGSFLSTSSLVNNPFTSFGSVNGALTGSNLVSGIPISPNPDLLYQPSYYTYNEFRPPLA
jgi:hypothetical protein